MAPSTATSVFISRIRGLPVLDGAGDQVGKVRDVVIQRRAAGRAPRVKGLVVESFARHRIFVPMAWVTRVDAVQVVITGPVNTRRFERRESEMLVIDDLFDLTVQRLDQPAPPSSSTWPCARSAPTTGCCPRWRCEVTESSRFARRGHATIVDWSEVDMLRVEHAQGTEQLIAQMEDMKPADVARELHDMSPERRAEIASALDDGRLADALEELPEDEQVQLITELDTDRAADVLEEMDRDDAADLIAELAPELAEDAAGADGARGRQGRPPAAQLRRVHRRRHDDAGAADPAARRDGRRGAGPGPRRRADPGPGLHGLRLPLAAGDPDRPLHRSRALPAAAPRTTLDAGLRPDRQRAGDR